jgi:pimeloyl-ACP methyl ester carboxylesterase
MRASDGVELAGWYLPSESGAAVVLRHGAASRAADTAAQARALHDEGYGVLATDARGHGASGGQGMDLGWYGEIDTQAAVDFLRSRAEVDPERIAAVGLSMGGEEVIGAAGVDDRICAVVAEGATGRTATDKAWLAEEYGPAGAVQLALDAVTYGVIDALAPAAPPASLAESIEAAADTSFLLIAAGEVRDEQLVARRLAQIDPDRVSVWVAEGAQHTAALQSSAEEWTFKVDSFLTTSLKVCSS